MGALHFAVAAACDYGKASLAVVRIASLSAAAASSTTLGFSRFQSPRLLSLAQGAAPNRCPPGSLAASELMRPLARGSYGRTPMRIARDAMAWSNAAATSAKGIQQSTSSANGNRSWQRSRKATACCRCRGA